MGAAGGELEVDVASCVGDTVTWLPVVCARAESVETKIENAASVAAAKASPAIGPRIIPRKYTPWIYRVEPILAFVPQRNTQRLRAARARTFFGSASS